MVKKSPTLPLTKTLNSEPGRHPHDETVMLVPNKENNLNRPRSYRNFAKHLRGGCSGIDLGMF